MSSKYIRNDINTLKAIAIIAVVLFHFFELVLSQHGNNIQDYLTSVCEGNHLINQIVKLLLFRGGYLGVDIFLVVSGFLICTSILTSLALPKHQFSLIHFYKRRFYRLSLPLIPLIIFCAVLGYFVLAPSISEELLKETYKSLFFISNQYFANKGGYFAINSLDKILLHTWYLSLIGQFYIVFPLIVLLINKLLGQRYLKAAIFALTIFTFVYAEQKFILSKADNQYYLSSMRAWELLFGASLAFIKLNINHKKLWFYIGISLLTAQILFTEAQDYNPLAILYVALSTAIVIIANYQNSWLNNKAVQFVGKSSYSLYLWHWPIMVFCSKLMIFEATWLVVTLTLITWIISYRLENLDKKYFWFSTLIYCLLCSTTLGIIKMNKKGYVDLYDFAVVKDLFEPWVKLKGNAKIIDNIVDKTKPITTLMIGDSNACHYLEYFNRVLNLKYVELHGSLQYGENVRATVHDYKNEFVNLYNNENKAISQMPDGSSVILANNWQIYGYFKASKDAILNVTPKYKDDVLGGIIVDIERLASLHPYLKFYIVSQPVRPTYSDLNPVIVMYYLGDKSKYLKKAWKQLGIIVKDEFKPENQYLVEKINARLKILADKHDNVYFIDRNIPVCNDKSECFLTTNDKPIYCDIDHLSIYGGELVGEYILKQIEQTKY